MSTKENGAAATGAAYDLWPMMRLCGAAIPALSGFNGGLYQSLAAMNTAWLELGNRRLKENLALPEHIAGCTTVPRLLWVYNSYCRTAVEDYQAAVAEIQRLGQNQHHAGLAFNRSSPNNTLCRKGDARCSSFVALRTAGNPRARNRLALGGANPSPGAPSASPSPLRAEALHCRQADNRTRNTKASKPKLWS